jgi:isocitrate dehydrogenase
MVIGKPGTASIVFKGDDGSVEETEVFKFKNGGVLLAMYNTDDSIASFAHSSFQVALQKVIFNHL